MATITQAESVTLDAEGKPCEEMVDLSETGQFHRLHFACAEKKAVRKPAEAAPIAVPAPAPEQNKAALAAPALATEILTARAPVDLAQAESLALAQHQLFQKMVQSCTHGWRKVSESVQQDKQHNHYQLTIQYQCLGR